MDQIPLVNEQIEDGKRLLERLVQEGVTVSAACWLKESEPSRWEFYIVSSLVGARNDKRPSYRRVRTLIQQMPQPFWVDFFDVRLERPGSPISKALQERIRSSNGRLPIRLASGSLGGLCGLEIDGGYLYPPISAPVHQA
ncbi:MAG: hypothetical protein HYS12_16025 [Planctomycetes bacterium]|nr:hypothetical protein [Planctomycetota bacterium]